MVHEQWERGTTTPGRLAALDRLLVRREAALLRRPEGGPFVDVGLGDHPATTLEAVHALRSVRADLRAVAVEIDAARVVRCRPALEAARVEVRCGGFEAVPEGCRVLRVMNVLRGYPPDQAQAARRSLASRLQPGGLWIEGTCGRTGDVGVVSAIRGAKVPHREAVIWLVDFGAGFAPRMFFPRIPGDLRRDPAVEAFLRDWTACWTPLGGVEARERFATSARRLAERHAVELDALHDGVVVWTAPPPLEG